MLNYIYPIYENFPSTKPFTVLFGEGEGGCFPVIMESY